MRLCEHRQNLEDLLEKSKLALFAYEEGHRVVCDEARILESESNIRHKKCKELTHIACSKTPSSQPSLDISRIWVPLIIDMVTKSNGSP
jgi:hypothetical protein